MKKDPYRYFRIEARELLAALQAGALELERGAASADAVARLLRHAHTLKGAARVVRLTEVAELAHEVEDLLAPLRGGGGEAGQELVTRLLATLDALASRVAALDQPAQASPDDAPPAPAAPPPATERVAAPDRRAERLEAVRVPIPALDRLLEALLALRADVDALGGRAGRDQGELLERLDRGLADLLADVGELRLVPAEVMLTTLERVARDAATTLGRRVEFRAEGGDVKLDAPVLAAVQEAMVQLVKNAVTHGVEDEAARLRAGKPAAGQVRVTIERAGARVVVRCADDGRGLDLDGIREAAVARGLVDRERAAALDAAGVRDLLLRGGVSTARTLTELAGRGVGMDIVRDVTDRVAGQVTIDSAPGRGTSIALDVPVSLAALRALVVEAAGEAFLLPLDAVEEGQRVQTDARAVPDAVLLGHGTAPFAPLGELLGLEQAAAPRPAWTTLHVSARGRRLALGVEHLRGVVEVVLRPLPAAVGRAPLVAGAAALADGSVALVLDPATLVEAAAGRGARAAAPRPPRLPLLVIDDSLTTRMLEETILTSAGYEVDLATSAEEGLELARLRRYGAFIVDVEMPGMNGFEFVARTRADPALRDVPAVLVSSRDAPEDLRRGQEVGASGYIVKGQFEEGRLLDLVAGLVEARRA